MMGAAKEKFCDGGGDGGPYRGVACSGGGAYWNGIGGRETQAMRCWWQLDGFRGPIFVAKMQYENCPLLPRVLLVSEGDERHCEINLCMCLVQVEQANGCLPDDADDLVHSLRH